MSVHVQYAPHPPQLSVELTAAPLAVLDARFGHLATLRRRRVLDQVVQDAADLLEAHIGLRAGRQSWQGTPGRLDEDGTTPSHPFVGWTELRLRHGLALDLGRPDLRPVAAAELFSTLASWRRGLVYLLCPDRATFAPVVRRRLNLANGIDRLELDHLSMEFLGDAVLRAHRLDGEGRLVMWRAALSRCDGATRWPAPLADQGDLHLF